MQAQPRYLIALALLFIGSTPALATPQIATSEDQPGEPQRTELTVGYTLGGNDVGAVNRFTRGVALSAGRRFGDLAVLAEYAYYNVGTSDSSSQGSMSRAGLVARYSLARTHNAPDRRPDPVSGDFWLEAGAGYERIAWDAGGLLNRPDVSIGAGVQLSGVGKRRSDPYYVGPFASFRATFARAPSAADGALPTCGGPCTMETRPSRNDVGLLVSFGINWSR